MTKASYQPNLHNLVDAEFPEEWEIIPKNTAFEASSHGRIRTWFFRGKRLPKPRMVTQRLSPAGYATTSMPRGIKKKDRHNLVHRLVLDAFLGERDELEVNHKNGIKADNRLSNLEWCTSAENRRHAVNSGLAVPPRGEYSSAAKLTEEQAAEIKRRIVDGQMPKSIGIAMGIAPHMIKNIKYGNKWSHIPWPYPSNAQ